MKPVQPAVELSRILAQLSSDGVCGEPFLVEISGFPDAVEGVLRDRNPARLPQVWDGILPQVAVQGRAGDAKQTTDLIDRVDSPSSTITRIFCNFLSSASMLTQSPLIFAMRQKEAYSAYVKDLRGPLPEKLSGRLSGT